jgi:hypothetical protein
LDDSDSKSISTTSPARSACSGVTLIAMVSPAWAVPEDGETSAPEDVAIH